MPHSVFDNINQMGARQLFHLENSKLESTVSQETDFHNKIDYQQPKPQRKNSENQVLQRTNTVENDEVIEQYSCNRYQLVVMASQSIHTHYT